jgi:hypothetical protein
MTFSQTFEQDLALPCIQLYYVSDVILSMYTHRTGSKVCLTIVGIGPATFGILIKYNTLPT